MKAGGGWMVGAAALLVVGLRLAAALPLESSPLLLHPVLEDSEYQSRALEIRDGAFLDTRLPRGSVLYPYLAALIPGLGQGGSRALAVPQCVLEGLTALLLMLWLRRRWGMAGALAAGLLYGLEPAGGFFAARFSPVVPATLAFVGCLWLWDHERRLARKSWGSSALIGVVATLGFLLLPLPFLFLLLIRGWNLLRERGGPKSSESAGIRSLRALLPLGMLGLVAAAVIAQHAPLPDGGPALGWGGGPALYNAFSPATGGTPRGLKPPSWLSNGDLQSQAWEGLAREGTHYDVFRYYAAQGLQRALENPIGTIGVLLSKIASTVGSLPVADSLSPVFLFSRGAPVFSYIQFSFALLLALGAAGLLFLRGDPLQRTLLLGLAAVGLGSLLGMASAASRQAAFPLLAALAGGWIAGCVRRDAGRFGPGTIGALSAGLAISLGAGFLSPAAALRNPSEDLRLLASTFTQTESLRQAVPLLEEAVEANPRNLDARISLAQAYQKDALVSAAEKQLEAAMQADSTHARTLFAMAVLREDRGRPDEALALMSRLVNLHPNNPLYLNELGQMLARKGEMGIAEQLFSQAVRLKPDYKVAQQNLEMILTYRQRLEESLFPPEMRLAPDDPLQQTVPDIVTAMDQERWREADSLISVAERERPDLLLPFWLRGAYCARRGELAPAIQALERCQKLAPGRPAVVAQLGQLYLAAGRAEKLEPLFRESLQAAGSDSTRTRAILALRGQLLAPKRPTG